MGSLCLVSCVDSVLGRIGGRTRGDEAEKDD